MPYIMVDEIPEGYEPADVIGREEYDKVIEERDSYEKQRDDAIAKINDAEKEVREAKAKYADYILSGSNQQQKQTESKKIEHGALSARELFKGKRG